MRERFYFIEEGEILLIMAQLEETLYDLKEILKSRDLSIKESKEGPVEVFFSKKDLNL